METKDEVYWKQEFDLAIAEGFDEKNAERRADVMTYGYVLDKHKEVQP